MCDFDVDRYLPATTYQLQELVKKIMPNAIFGQADNGELIIESGYLIRPDEYLTLIEEDEEETV